MHHGDVCAPDGNYDAFLKLIDVFAGACRYTLLAGDEDPAPIAAQPNTPERVKADYVLAAEEHGAIYLDSPQKLTVGKSAVWFCPESMYGLDIDSSRCGLSGAPHGVGQAAAEHPRAGRAASGD